MKIKMHRLWVALFLIMFGCKIKPEPIVFGEDHCSYCKMSIADPKFGAELVTNKGKIYKFDAMECMVPYIEENQGEFAFIMGIAHDKPGSLVSVDSLHFVISEHINSPMGGNIGGFLSEFPVGEELMSWEELRVHLITK